MWGDSNAGAVSEGGLIGRFTTGDLSCDKSLQKQRRRSPAASGFGSCNKSWIALANAVPTNRHRRRNKTVKPLRHDPPPCRPKKIHSSLHAHQTIHPRSRPSCDSTTLKRMKSSYPSFQTTVYPHYHNPILTPLPRRSPWSRHNTPSHRCARPPCPPLHHATPSPPHRRPPLPQEGTDYGKAFAARQGMKPARPRSEQASTWGAAIARAPGRGSRHPGTWT